jgi:hypothetical protein
VRHLREQSIRRATRSGPRERARPAPAPGQTVASGHFVPARAAPILL